MYLYINMISITMYFSASTAKINFFRCPEKKSGNIFIVKQKKEFYH